VEGGSGAAAGHSLQQRVVRDATVIRRDAVPADFEDGGGAVRAIPVPKGENKMRMSAAREKGFTLIELVIVIAVIAILAAILVPTILSQADKARIASEKNSIAELAKSMRRYRIDVGDWPYGGPPSSPSGQWNHYMGNLGPAEFTTEDTALFVMPTAHNPALERCQAAKNVDMTCWGGPYLPGSSLAEAAMMDQWGHKRMFLMINPANIGIEGVPEAPNGMVLVWSRGPNNKDETACSTPQGAPDPGCNANYSRMAQAQPSSTAADADDIVVMAGTGE